MNVLCPGVSYNVFRILPTTGGKNKQKEKGSKLRAHFIYEDIFCCRVVFVQLLNDLLNRFRQALSI